MKAWRLEKLGGRLSLDDVPKPAPRPGSVLVRIEATALLSYLKAYVEGKLPRYNPPPGPFTIGTNAIGTVEAVGQNVWHIGAGRRVVLSPHFVARENVDDPAQILIGLTASADAGPFSPTGRTEPWPNMRWRRPRRSPRSTGSRIGMRRDSPQSPASSSPSAAFCAAGSRPERRFSLMARRAPSEPPPFSSASRWGPLA